MMAGATRCLHPLSRPTAYVRLLPFRSVATGLAVRPVVPVRTVTAQAAATQAKEAKKKGDVYRQTDLYDELALKADIEPKMAKELAESVFSIIEGRVAEGKRVMILGFGTFEPRSRPPRQARNPRTGEAIEIRAKTVPVFSPAKKFKELVDSPGAATDGKAK
eukprot:jgi/Botrbrau1/15136/Bobra.0149s0008.1